MTHRLRLGVLAGTHVVVRLPAAAVVPAWLPDAGFVSVTRTADELSIVCPAAAAPAGLADVEGGWRILRVEGPLDFALTGVLASLATPLAEAGVSIFAMSTFDTDYVLVKDHDLSRARSALTAAGHTVADA